jgi:glycosyltransferase involved in cell wall biosynthesis
MRIAQVSPLYERVPPVRYGGTERIVSYLTEELVRRGHEVSLYASGDSLTSARLVPGSQEATRLNPRGPDHNALLFVMLEQLVAEAEQYDLIHFHVDFYHFPFSRRRPVPQVTTLHGRQDIPGLAEVYRRYADMPLVFISNAQREPVPDAHWVATVYHGMPRADISFEPDPSGYLVYLSRFSPEKRADRAIEIARRAGMPLKLLGKVDKTDEPYFEAKVRPFLKDEGIEYLGECGETEKREVLSKARVLLFPIDWPEPFGMVLIEAMAAGTPCLGWPCGSVPEVLADRRSGRVVNSIPEAVEAIGELVEADRAAVRQVFEERFSVERMVDDYEAVYRRVMGAARDAGGAVVAKRPATSIGSLSGPRISSSPGRSPAG